MAEKKNLTACMAIGAFFVFLFGIVVVWKVVSDPNIPFLYSEQGAKWIRFREPTSLKARSPQTRVTTFRTRFMVDTVPGHTVLNFRAMKLAEVRVDGRLLYTSGPSYAHEWKHVYHTNLSPGLSPGAHELSISVQNTNGHPALLAYSIPLRLYTGEEWEASVDGETWSAALPVDEREPLSLARSFQRADKALMGNLSLFIPIFVGILVINMLFARSPAFRWRYCQFIPTAGTVRWILLSLWVILSLNNVGKIPLDVGMDIDGHMKYIRHIVTHARIPLATEGWQMFQPPLFYVLSAAVYKIFFTLLTPETLDRIMRVIPLVCGGLQIELCYRTVRYIYPERNDLQIAGVLLGGLLPMNIYISQFAGNEPLAGCLSGAVVLITVRILSAHSTPSMFDLLALGLCLGCAILTKVSSLLLVVPVVIFLSLHIAFKNESQARGMARAVKALGFVFGMVIVVSGWYFIRNWIEVGQVIIGGWESSRNIVWWQDPGFRTPHHFFTFGETLFYPVYSAVVGFWDGLYSTLWVDGYLSAYNRPPWNYGFMLSGVWLSLLTTGAIMLGILSVLITPERQRWQGLLFSVFCVGIYFFAILYLYLSVPVLSVAKATYAIGVTPCLAVLCASGFEILTKNAYVGAFAYGVFACWAFASYAAYFVI
ncbi:MAG: phospholipid carrier-dependent glycosyltransferase [Deltaproteobacteria bacterium]|nr:phospholipid carrier-dependent glycosyltransferase [Deltaproteobacteria bacterium]